MANIMFPSNIGQSRFDMRLIRAQNINQSINLTTKVTDLGPARWEVSTLLHALDNVVSLDESGSALAAFVQSLDGPKNTVELPLQWEKTTADVLLVNSTLSASGTFEYTVSGSTSSFMAGQCCRVGNRVYQVTNVTSNTLQLIPAVKISNLTRIAPADTIRVRLVSVNDFVIRSKPNNFGEVLLRFEEAVI